MGNKKGKENGKMKLSCNIVKDLWILYENDECSEDSKKAVEQHLAECKACQQSFKRLHLPKELVMPEKIEKTEQTERAVKKSVHKIKKRWMISLVAVLSIIPLVVCGAMGVNQYRGEGICYSNLDEILVTKQFLTEAQNGNLEQAVKMVDFREEYESVCEAFSIENPDVVEIHLADEVWIAKTYFAEEWFDKNYYTEEETEDLWSYLIDNVNRFWGEICIPEEIWNETEREAQYQYKTWETEYGVFYEPQDAIIWDKEQYISQEKEWITAIDLYARSALIPKEVYEVVRPILEQEIEENHKWLENQFGNVLELTLEEYSSHMQEKLVKALQTYEKTGAKIIEMRYEDSYYVEDAWRVQYRLVEKNRVGKENVLVLEFNVQDGKVDLVAFRYKGDSKHSGTILEDVVLNWKLEY